MKILKTIVAIAILTISCSKDNDEPQPQPETPKVTTVYVGGTEKDTEPVTVNTKNIPIIWKDGVAQKLPIATGNEGEVLAIFVDGNDIYAVGHENSSTAVAAYNAVMWKNGIKTTLSNGAASAKAIYVFNGKPYIVGAKNQVATLWYDNTSRVLSNGVEATGIYVKNNDIYISGNTATGMGFWKSTDVNNFVLNDIATSNPFTIASSISVQDNNVYIAGFSVTTSNVRYAKLWNANLISNEQYGDNTAMWSVFAQGQNVYACGYKVVNMSSTRAMLWKNNQPTQLSQNLSFAYSVFATPTDNYVAGSETVLNSKACIWKNGKIQTLSTKNSAATSVFVTVK